MARLNAANGTLDVTTTAGKTWSVLLTIRDSDGDLVNLTGYTAAWQMRDTFGGTLVASGTTAAPGYLVLGGAAGTIKLTVPRSVTATVAPGQYVHEFEWASGGGVAAGISGTWIVEPEVVQ